MPAFDLDRGPETLSRYDVVGQRVEGHTHFVTHVGFYNADNQTVASDEEVVAVHMLPPLSQETTMNVHVAGRVPFTNDERKEISAWFTEIRDEYNNEGIRRIRQYIIKPPWKDECDENTGVRRYRRYSCVGFVLDGHCQVDIELLKIDADSLHDVEKETIMSVYPDIEGHENLLPDWGLEGNGPWKIVLPGYVLRALDQPANLIRQEPYQAQEGDEQFWLA